MKRHFIKTPILSSTSPGRTEYVWSYQLSSPDEYFQLLDEWTDMFEDFEACELPYLPADPVSQLDVHAIVDIDSGYYEQWAVCDGEEGEHQVYTDIKWFPNEYNGNHPQGFKFYEV